MEVISLPNGGWMTKEFADGIKSFYEKQQKKFVMHLLKEGAADKFMHRSKLKEDNRKYAYIFVGKTRKLAHVDNKTMKAYKSDGYAATWIEIKNFKFDRWCTSMDL